ncbi:unnamed protein product [Acanthoscelides obtectus]|uniref:Uncharacterized protein n=1 Tax=Acanthoscelides obtectus TaxID=200917 RepID=A0A9P0KJC6_ACAOB|nr:unnamed protein product [Acanthoscelides obtectus]CAK1625591.1 hypothetical protein AOBTE_LOCUS3252 [Acanthoscelides obtectus]
MIYRTDCTSTSAHA